MEHQLRIPESYPMREQLEKAITDLLVFVEAGTIYISFDKQQQTPIVITFILKKNCGQDSNVMEHNAKKVLKTYSHFVFRFINATHASHGFKNGDPYLIRHCTVNELVYYESDNKVFCPVNPNSKELLIKATLSLKEDKEITMEVFQFAVFHMKNKENLKAAVEMYRAFWSLISCYIALLGGKFGEETDTSFGSILADYKRITAYAPHLKELLDLEKLEDLEMLGMLVNAHEYKDQKFGRVEISSEELELVKQKFELLSNEFDRLFSEWTIYCEKKMEVFRNPRFLGKSIFTEKVQSHYIMDLALSNISNLITGTLKTRVIYCFGYNIVHETKREDNGTYFRKRLPRYHFYLLVLTEEYKENAISIIQSIIRDNFDNQYQLTILHHRMQNLRKQSQNQKHFFDAITTNGVLTYYNSLHPISWKTSGAARDLEFSKKYWQNRILAAKRYLVLAQEHHEPEVPLITNSILQQGVKQVIVGLIDLFLGYHPNKNTINYLFSLLYYLDIIELPFDLSIEKERVCYQLLSASSAMILHKDLKNKNKEDNDFLLSKCEKFLILSEQVGNNEVEGMERKTYE